MLEVIDISKVRPRRFDFTRTRLASAKILRVGILMTGKRGSLADIWRWVREK